MLRPKDLGSRRALRQAMHILDVGIVAALRRHEFGVHAFAGELPARAAVGALPGAAAGDRDGHFFTVEADRVDAGLVVAAAEPFGTLLAIPQRAHQRPALAAVAGPEQASGNAARPEIVACAFERPDLHQLPGHLVIVAFRLGGVSGSRDLVPGVAAIIGTVELDAEMAEVQRCIDGLALRQHGAHGIAEEVRFADRPAAFVDDEQALPGSDVKRHGQPPVNACSTWIALSPRTASPRPARRPSTKMKTCFLSSPCSSST